MPDRPRPPFIYEVREWAEQEARVECFSGKDPSDVVHEGRVLGYTEAPTVVVQTDDGRIVHWVLGITRRKPVEPVIDDRCCAHGNVNCELCHLTKPGGLDEQGDCTECGVYGSTGMHWDTCPNRARAVVWSTDPVERRATAGERTRYGYRAPEAAEQ